MRGFMLLGNEITARPENSGVVLQLSSKTDIVGE